MSTSINILNAIRDVAGAEYQARIPEATRENIATVGNTILSYTPTTNAFMTDLINRIGRTIIKHMDNFDDIYSVFKDERLEMGDTVQKIFVDIPTAHAFEGSNTLNPASMLAVEKGTIHVEYTKTDRKMFYKRTISIPELKEAFVNVATLDQFIQAIIDSMARALGLDKYIMVTNTLYEHCCYVIEAEDTLSADLRVFKVPTSVARYNNTNKVIEWETLGAKEFLKALRVVSRGLKFPHKLDYAKYNNVTGEYVGAGEISAIKTPVERQVIGLEVSTLAEIDVEALAVLFNMSKAEPESRIIELEDGALGQYVMQDGSAEDWYIGGFVCDKDAVERGTTFEDKDSFKNPEHEYVNYWQHYWGYMAVSKFADFVPIVFEMYTPQA